MDPITLGIIVSGILGAGGIAASLFGQKKANETNIKLAKEAQEFEKQQVEEMNKYNAPTQQITRLQDAGLNPRLMYGKSSDTGNQSGMASGRMPTVKNTLENMMKVDPLGTLQSYNAVRQQRADRELTEAKLGQVLSQTSKLDAEGQIKHLDALIKLQSSEPELKSKLAKYGIDAEKLKQQVIQTGRQKIDIDAYKSITEGTGMSKEMQTLTKLLFSLIKK